jgi:outer membrane receptor for ferrienterochelin and colicins
MNWLKAGCLLAVIVVMIATSVSYAQDSTLSAGDLSIEALLNTKISTAAKYTQTVSQAPASVTIITSDEIQRYGYHTLKDVLSGVRGFYSSYDRNYNYLGVRGFGRPTDYNNRILILLNGHTLNEIVFGSAPVGTELGLNLKGVERIEVVRGPGSALYGTGAMFAIINIITKKGNDIDGLQIDGETGSYGRALGSMVWGKEISNNWDITVSGQVGKVKGQRLYFKEYDDSSTNYGVADNLDRDQFYGFLTTLSYKKFSFEAFRTFREKEVPTGAWDAIFNARNAKTRDEWNFIDAKYEEQIKNNLSLSVKGSYNFYTYKGWFPYNSPTFDDSYGRWFGSEARFCWDLKSNNRLIVGGEYQDILKASYRYWDAETTYFDRNSPSYAVSLYIQDDYQIRKDLSITLGIRRDRYITPASTTTPRVGIIYNPFKSSTLKLLYGEAFRKPNIYESYYEDPISGYKPNKYLKPEKIQTMEIAWEQRFGNSILGTVSIYDYAMNNLIDQVIDPSDSQVQYRNISKIKARGVEIEMDAQMKRGFASYISIAYQKARNSESDSVLTNSPAFIAKGGISYLIRKCLNLASELRYESERLTIQNSKTKSFILANLNVAFRPTCIKAGNLNNIIRKLDITLSINNVFDVSYESPAGYEHKENAIPQDKRNFILSAGYRF